MIETNRFFLQKERVNKIELRLKRDSMRSENVKVPHHLQIWECPPPKLGALACNKVCLKQKKEDQNTYNIRGLILSKKKKNRNVL